MDEFTVAALEKYRPYWTKEYLMGPNRYSFVQ